jgi:phenylpropionate dioxygenase-like ring-hydroxylating dioxygenase large terminal subunit/AcrR family transcriptional regulator
VTKTTVVKEARQRQLIEATIAVICRNGYSNTTLAQVAGDAGLSPGIVNFYFKSKEQLLVATLEYLADEYERVRSDTMVAAGESPAAALLAMIEADFHPEVCTHEKMVVWYAFSAEMQAQPSYYDLLSKLEARYFDQTRDLVARLVAEGGYRGIDSTVVATGLNAMIDGFWYDLLVDPVGFDRGRAKQACRLFLRGIFPAEFGTAGEGAEQDQRAVAEDAAASFTTASETLPAWIYTDPEFLDLERKAIFEPAWQPVCHEGEIRQPGDFATFDLLGNSAFLVRGDDGALRAFHNVCRHRGARLLDGASGHCARAVECPVHGWSYDFHGRLKAVPADRSFTDMDWEAHGLRPVDLEIFQGFVFVRFAPGGMALAETLGLYAEELSAYKPAEMVPLGPLTTIEVPLNWKLLIGNYLEGYEVAAAHPGLARLFGRYQVEASDGVTRAIGTLSQQPSPNWSERHYQRLLPLGDHLPTARQRSWCYYSLFPNLGVGVHPDMISLFHVVPIASDASLVRLRDYGLPGEDRALRVARYLNARINRQVLDEDIAILDRVQRGLSSRSFETGLLADSEIGLRRFSDWLRTALPVARLRQPPAGPLDVHNADLTRVER